MFENMKSHTFFYISDVLYNLYLHIYIYKWTNRLYRIFKKLMIYIPDYQIKEFFHRLSFLFLVQLQKQVTLSMSLTAH